MIIGNYIMPGDCSVGIFDLFLEECGRLGKLIVGVEIWASISPDRFCTPVF